MIIRYTVLFVWTAELFPSSYSSFVSTALTASIGVTYAMVNTYMMFVSRSFVPISIINEALQVLVFLAILLMPESPTWLLSTGQTEGAIASFHKIARLNGRSAPQYVQLEGSLKSESGK